MTQVRYLTVIWSIYYTLLHKSLTFHFQIALIINHFLWWEKYGAAGGGERGGWRCYWSSSLNLPEVTHPHQTSPLPNPQHVVLTLIFNVFVPKTCNTADESRIPYLTLSQILSRILTILKILQQSLQKLSFFSIPKYQEFPISFFISNFSYQGNTKG